MKQIVKTYKSVMLSRIEYEINREINNGHKVISTSLTWDGKLYRCLAVYEKVGEE